MRPSAWASCKDITFAESPEEKRLVASYVQKSGTSPVYTVWLDLETDTVCGLDFNYYNNVDEAAMLTNKNVFITDFKHGASSISSIYGELFSNAKNTSEIVLSTHQEHDKYKNSKILVVGGGPSVVKCEWNADDYDYLWSCNGYYKAPFLKDFQFDLVNLGGEVDLQDEELLNRLRRDKTEIMFDAKISRNENSIRSFNKLIHPLKTNFYVTRYFGKIGTASRMIVLATLLGASEVGFVGMDGPVSHNKISEHNHTIWEPAKKGSGPTNYHNIKRQYVMFWDYVLNVLNQQPGVQESILYRNLGASYEHNLTSHIKADKIIQ